MTFSTLSLSEKAWLAYTLIFVLMEGEGTKASATHAHKHVLLTGACTLAYLHTRQYVISQADDGKREQGGNKGLGIKPAG